MSDAEADNRISRWDALLGIGAEREAVAEVERLRVMNADLRLMIDGLESAAHEERAAVVAHLRERAIHGASNTVTVEDVCTILADLFERGEHRREEEL